MDSGEDLIRNIVNCILAIATPERIILFGSAATGSMTPDSDLDLLVIEGGFKSQREEGIRLRMALRNLGIPVDVFAMTPERFEETKGVIGGLAYPAHKYGKVIYEAS
jgi:predicted nucleotidyltransferase